MSTRVLAKLYLIITSNIKMIKQQDNPSPSAHLHFPPELPRTPLTCHPCPWCSGHTLHQWGPAQHWLCQTWLTGEGEIQSPCPITPCCIPCSTNRLVKLTIIDMLQYYMIKMKNVLDDCCGQLLIVMDGEPNHSMGVQMTGLLPHSSKTKSDRRIKDNRLTNDYKCFSSVDYLWVRKCSKFNGADLVLYILSVHQCR